MFSIRRKVVMLAMLAIGAVAGAAAQTKQNALTQINWVPVTGTVAPTSTSCGGTCTSAFYGLPYTNLTNGNYYIYTGTGAVSGWQLVTSAGSGGITQLTGDGTAGPGAGSQALTLATVYSGTPCNTISGLYWCVNAKGLTTALGPPFAASLTCGTNALCGTFEAGVSSTSPANFTAGYSNPSVPTSASIEDNFYNASVACTSSFTACVLPHQYCTVAQGLSVITYTLTAVGNSQTQTPTQGANCTYRTFAGAGTAGATGATASGTSAVLVGATGTLTNAGLGNQGAYNCTASSQKCYVLMQGSSHTFNLGPNPFPMNTPTAVGFVNVNGVTTPLYLYESTNSLIGTFTLTVAS